MLRNYLNAGDVAMATPEFVVPYIDPESKVLQHLSGAQSWEELSGAEAALASSLAGQERA